MTLDPDRRAAIRALAVQNADPARSSPAGGVARQRLTFVSLGVAVVVLIGAVVAIVGVSLPISPVAGPVPGATATASPDVDADAAVAADAAPALGLVGLWSLTDAPGEPSAAVRIDATTIMVYRDCGVLLWDFAAANGLLATVGPGGSEPCFRDADGSAAPMDTGWGDSLRGYRAVSGGWELLDGSGAVVGRLSGISELPDSITVTDAPTDPPLLDEQARALLQNAVPLPSPWVPATHDDLLGTWKVADDTQVAGATITFRDGDYVVRECVSAGQALPAGFTGQAWTGDGRLFVAAEAASAAVACTPTLPIIPSQIRTIAIADGDLVLFDARGVELGRLERAEG